MLYFLLCFVLAALPALGAVPDVTPVVVYTHFERPPTQRVAASIRQEVETIMAPLGFPIEWKSLDGVRGDEVSTSLAVVTFRGGCDTVNLLTSGQTTPLGITYVSDKVVLPFTEIECDRVRIFLRKQLIQTDSAERDSAFGRAVGRVLAHELFHVFAGTVHHGADGIAKPMFTERELLAPRFQFASSEFRVLRASLKQARQQNKRLRPAASPAVGEFIFREDGCAKCHGRVGQGTKAGPALRLAGAPADVKAIAAKLVEGAVRMCNRARSVHIVAEPMDDDEIADVASFLGSN